MNTEEDEKDKHKYGVLLLFSLSLILTFLSLLSPVNPTRTRFIASERRMKSFLSTLLLSGLAVASSQPNILFVLTDDQDKHMGSPEYMPKLQVSSAHT